MTTQPAQAQPVEQEPANPILAEIAELDATGDDADIVQELAVMDAADAGTPPPTPQAATVPPAVETPAATRPATPATPPVDPQVQQYIQRLEAQQQQARGQEDMRALENYSTTQAQALEEQYGLAPEQALTLARQQGQAIFNEYRAEQSAKQQVMESEAKSVVAIRIAKQHGADPEALMKYRTPQEMVAAATQQVTQSKQASEVAALRAEVERLKKGGVPPQTFDNGRPAAVVPNTDSALLDQYNMGVRTPQTRAAAAKAAGR
jgi:hypothetical protein